MPHDNLHIALLPIDMQLGKNDLNISAISNLMSEIAPETDLVLLPEMCVTGYSTDGELLAQMAEDDNDSPSLKALHALAMEKKTAICGSLAVKNQDKYFNRGFFINPDSGEVTYYDKHHLFTMGHENLYYTPGAALPPIIEFRGWKISMVICYDLRFPVWTRNVACAYDLLLIPANWPMSRDYAWRQLIIARAIENQAYVAGCDRLGNDEYGSYSQMQSLVVSPRGEDLSTPDQSGFIYAVLNGAKLDRDREKFPVWEDADSFDISI